MNKHTSRVPVLCIVATLSALACSPARAGLDVPPLPADLSAITAQLAAVQASVPVPASSVAPLETVGGAPGSTMTFRRGDAVQPRITRTASCALVISGGMGTCTTTWDTSSFPTGTTIRLAGAPAVVDTTAGAATDQPIDCKAYAVSLTGISFRCWQAQSSVVSLLGATVLPFSAPASSVTVQVTAIPSS
jgi:hypothetical protein